MTRTRILVIRLAPPDRLRPRADSPLGRRQYTTGFREVEIDGTPARQHGRSGVPLRTAAGLLIFLCLTIAPARPAAHDIPADVLVQLFVKPEGHTLHAVVRVPLEAMRDVNFPTRGPGYLAIEDAEAAIRVAAWIWIAGSLAIYENGDLVRAPELVNARVSLPSDRSFQSYDAALRHFQAAPVPADIDLPWQQALLDVHLRYPIDSDASEFSVAPGFARLGVRTTTVLRFLPPGGSVRAFQYHGDPGLIRLDPRWHHAALRFVGLGFEHILSGIDHLLFLLCLVIPFRRVLDLVLVVTSFTVAHSITLIASALGAVPESLWFPPFIETLIAATIVYMALENIVLEARTTAAADAAGVPALRRRWILTFAFGLVHGFGFSFALRESLQFGGSHLLTSLVAFNVGVELGQLVVLAIALPALALVFRHVVPGRLGAIILSGLVAHTGWHWMTERGAELGQYAWPQPDVFWFLAFVRWLMLAVGIAALVWLVKRLRSGSPSPDGTLRDSGRGGTMRP